MDRNSRQSIMIATAIASVAAVFLLWVFASVWVSPIVKLLYETRFEGAVEKALSGLPDFDNACIYDDTANIFVTSARQLNVGKMIENAVKSKVPKHPLSSDQRDPHFRVYTNGHTYYWSFWDEEFHAFWGDRWTLAGQIERTCQDYKQHAQLHEEAFYSRDGIAVSQANFCCKLKPETRP